MQSMNAILTSLFGAITNILNALPTFVSKYGKWIMVAVVLYAASHVFHLRISKGGGGSKK